MLQQNAPDLLAKGEDKPDLTGRIEAIQQELDDLEAQARALVIKQAQAHNALTSIYDEQLQALGDRIDILQHGLAAAEREEKARDTSAATAAFHTLPDKHAQLWEWDGAAINQMLHRLMGRRRLVVIDGQIVETRDAPPHPNKQERKRTYYGKNRSDPTR
jgi:chromosome segregation ATPase